MAEGQTESAEAPAPLTVELQHIERQIESLRAAGLDDEARKREESLEDLLFDFKRRIEVDLNRKRAAQQSAVDRDTLVAKRLIALLRSRGRDQLAAELERRLDRTQQRFQSGRFEFPESDEPELHSVTVRQGMSLPDAFRTDETKNRFRFAEVNVQYSARPVILGLASDDPMLWKINTAEGVRIHAVVVSCPDYKVEGPADVLVVPQADSLERTTGRIAATELRLEAYVGEPVVLGATNPLWLAAYFRPELDAIISAARQELQRLAAVDLDDLRFRAVYSVSFPAISRPAWFNQASEGEFTFAGPIQATLKPLGPSAERQWVTIPQSTIRFAISDDHRIVRADLSDASSVQPTDVLMPLQMRRGHVLHAMAYDALRHRVVVSAEAGRTARLYGYDINLEEWTRLCDLQRPIAALAFNSGRDQLIGIITPDNRHPEDPPTLIRLSSQGDVISSHPIAGLPDRTAWSTGELQLVEDARGRIILLTPAKARDLSTDTELVSLDQLYVLDPNTISVTYSGPIRAHNQVDQLRTLASRRRVLAGGDGILAELDERFAQAERDIARLIADQKADLAGQLESRLKQLRRFLHGDVVKRDDERLFAVGFYEGRPTTVRVTDTSGPIVLAVSSYERVPWTIEVDPGVEVRKIIVGGHEQPQILFSPPNIPVEQHSFYTYPNKSDDSGQAVKSLKELTGLDLATLLGEYRSSGATVLVGPQNAQWRIQEACRGLDQIIADAQVDQWSDKLTALEQHEFYAVHCGSLPGQPNAAGGRFAVSMYVCRFTIKGPLIAHAKPLRGRQGTVAYDPSKRIAYVMERADLSSLDLVKGGTTNIAWDKELPRIGFTAGIAFDTKRHRLVVHAFGPHGGLYAYDQATDKWSVLSHGGFDASDIAYAADEDLLLVADGGFGSDAITCIYRCNANGALLDRIRLAKPIRLIGSRPAPFGPGPQLAYLQGHLAVLQYPDVRPIPPGAAREPAQPATITVVDLADGRIVYEGELQPHRKERNLSMEELDHIWRRLADADEPADDLIWDMAVGGERTVAFLGEKLLAPPPPPNVDLQALIRQLDSDQFSDRQQAFVKLQSLGSQIADQLREAVAGRPSAEVAERLQNLLDQWQNGQPHTPDERQKVRGLEVLARIDSAAAKRLLGRIAESGPFAVQRRAEQLLKETAASAP
jgi:hypothetical protein